MDAVTWSPEMSVGVQIIDNQHQSLFQIINDLHHSIEREGGEKRALNTILQGLIDYTEYHFETEEEYFEEFAYPEKEAHKIKHQEFTDKIIEYKKEVAGGNITIFSDLMNYLKVWWVNHIQVCDKKYAKHFHEHGLR